MSEKELIGVRVSPETKEKIENQLEYGDSLSAWLREAANMRLSIESQIDNQDELPDRWWEDTLQEFEDNESGDGEGNPPAAQAAD